MRKIVLTDEQRKLVEDHQRLVYFVIRRLGLRGQDSFDDAFQIGVMGLMKAALAYIPGKASFATFARKCIGNELRSARRKNFIRERYIITSLDEPVKCGDGCVPRIDTIQGGEAPVDSALLAQEQEQECLMLLDALPDRAEAVILKKYVFGTAYQKDIANELGITQSYVSKIIKKARAQLRTQCMDRGDAL